MLQQEIMIVKSDSDQHSILYYTILHYTSLFYRILYCTILYYPEFSFFFSLFVCLFSFYLSFFCFFYISIHLSFFPSYFYLTSFTPPYFISPFLLQVQLLPLVFLYLNLLFTGKCNLYQLVLSQVRNIDLRSFLWNLD